MIFLAPIKDKRLKGDYTYTEASDFKHLPALNHSILFEYAKFIFLFFLSVVKDLANRWTDVVLLYNEASHRSRKVFDYFGEGYLHPPKIFFFLLFIFRTKIEKEEGRFLPLPPIVPLEASSSKSSKLFVCSEGSRYPLNQYIFILHSEASFRSWDGIRLF